jgi:hypothetical protein
MLPLPPLLLLPQTTRRDEQPPRQSISLNNANPTLDHLPVKFLREEASQDLVVVLDVIFKKIHRYLQPLISINVNSKSPRRVPTVAVAVGRVTAIVVKIPALCI